MKLGNIATVRSGLVLSRKHARNSQGIRYLLMNLRSINTDGYIDVEQLDVFDSTETLSEDYLSRVGDVIVRLSVPYTAVLIDETTAGMVVSSNFVIIRANSKELLPAYLFWLLNTKKVKRSIYENSGSNMLGSINAKYFVDLDIPQLPIVKQRIIADMHELALKEIMLLKRLSEEKQRYYSLMFGNIHKEMKRGN